jgi:hypothetical protein
MSRMHQIPVHVDNVNLLVEKLSVPKKSVSILLEIRKETNVEFNIKKTK